MIADSSSPPLSHKAMPAGLSMLDNLAALKAQGKVEIHRRRHARASAQVAAG